MEQACYQRNVHANMMIPLILRQHPRDVLCRKAHIQSQISRDVPGTVVLML